MPSLPSVSVLEDASVLHPAVVSFPRCALSGTSAEIVGGRSLRPKTRFECDSAAGSDRPLESRDVGANRSGGFGGI